MQTRLLESGASVQYPEFPHRFCSLTRSELPLRLHCQGSLHRPNFGPLCKLIDPDVDDLTILLKMFEVEGDFDTLTVGSHDW